MWGKGGLLGDAGLATCPEEAASPSFHLGDGETGRSAALPFPCPQVQIQSESGSDGRRDGQTDRRDGRYNAHSLTAGWIRTRPPSFLPSWHVGVKTRAIYSVDTVRTAKLEIPAYFTDILLGFFFPFSGGRRGGRRVGWTMGRIVADDGGGVTSEDFHSPPSHL